MYNGGVVWEEWWECIFDCKCFLVSFGIVKLMVDGLDLIFWVMDFVGEVDVEIILYFLVNVCLDLCLLLLNVCLVDWFLMGVFFNGVDGFIYYGGVGNILMVLYVGIL